MVRTDLSQQMWDAIAPEAAARGHGGRPETIRAESEMFKALDGAILAVGEPGWRPSLAQ